MTLTKTKTIDQITVIEDGTVLVRECTKILEDGVEFSKQYLRLSFAPNSDISSQPKNVQDICNIAWTPEIIANYETQVAKLNLTEATI